MTERTKRLAKEILKALGISSIQDSQVESRFLEAVDQASWQFSIACDRCHVFNKKLPKIPETCFFCYDKRTCPGEGPDDYDNWRRYRAKLDHGIQKGHAKRIA